MASANEKAIGTPLNTVTATTPTKNTTRFHLPSVPNSGASSQKAATIAAVPASATTMRPGVATRGRRSSAVTSISAMPSGMAAARQPLLISSAGVTMKRSSAA